MDLTVEQAREEVDQFLQDCNDPCIRYNAAVSLVEVMELILERVSITCQEEFRNIYFADGHELRKAPDRVVSILDSYAQRERSQVEVLSELGEELALYREIIKEHGIQI